MDHKNRASRSEVLGVTGANDSTSTEELINASGHVQELKRNFNLLSLTGIGLTVGNVWPACGGSILVALFNGGPPGVLYEFITVSVFYWIVALSIAELASAIPSCFGVGHWAAVAGGRRYGPFMGFLAGWWNYFAWVLGAASMCSILGNTIVQMYALKHPDFIAKAWHVFIVYIIVAWMGCFIVCSFNRAMPYLNNIGIFCILGGFFITIIVLAVMPGTAGRPPHASANFVFTEWSADIGYPNGFVFAAGMLNGAYSVGTPDVTSHLAEEIPDPSRNIPIAIGLQMAIGFATGLCYFIAILFAINDFDALFESPYPIAEIYRQSVGANGAIGLLFLILLCIIICVVGLYITAGRMLYGMARDGATPFSAHFAKIHPKLDMPLMATLVTGLLVTALGCIYIGSTTAFNAFVGSFVIMSSSSYIAAILPHLLSGRKNITYGKFHLNKWYLGFICNAIACAYMIVWFVIYCFPFALPVTAASMNYACLIWGALTIFVIVWWFIGPRKYYQGPKTTGGQNLIDMVKDVSQIHKT